MQKAGSLFREPASCCVCIKKSLFSQLKRFAVGALIHSGVHFMSTHGDAVQSTVILVLAMIGTLLHCAFNAMVSMAGIHLNGLLSFGVILRMSCLPFTMRVFCCQSM